jgi:transposase
MMDGQETAMPAIKYRVSLGATEVERLKSLLHKGKSAARKQTRARILLKAAAGCQDSQITEALGVSASMVARVRQRCVEEGVDAALADRPRPGAAPKLSESQCAQVIALSSTPAPAGHDHWTLRLLAEQVVRLGFSASFSHEAVRQLLKKHLGSAAPSGRVEAPGGHRLARPGRRRSLTR